MKAKILKIGTCDKLPNGNYVLSGWEFDSLGAAISLSPTGFMGWSYEELYHLSRLS